MDDHMTLLARRMGSPRDEGLAADEHRAFAREWVQGNLLRALVMAGLVPGYQVAKLLGRPFGVLDGGTPASLGQMGAGYRGILEGLVR